MANRFFNQFGLTLEKSVVTLFARVTIGSSGAPTLDTSRSMGIKTVTRSSAGKYVITFGVPTPTSTTDIYNALLFVQNQFTAATGTPAAPLFFKISDAVSTAGTVTIQFTAVDGTTATDPASGEVMHLLFHLKNSTAK